MRAAALDEEVGVLALLKMTLGGFPCIVEPADLY